MPLSKNINPSLVLVQPRKTRPFIIERLLMGRKESNQTNKQTKTFDGLMYSKISVKRPLSKRAKIGFQDQLLLNAGQKHCRLSNGNILQYFRPSLSCHLSLRSLFYLFLSGRFTQVLLYCLCFPVPSKIPW